MADVADLAVRLSLDDKFSRGIKGATGSLSKFEKSVGRVGQGAGKLSTGLARAGTVIGTGLVVGLGGAAKAAIDFEDAFAGVRKTVDETDLKAAGLSFDDLEKSFRDMAKRIPIAATDFARLGETAGALGVLAGDIDEFVETTALLGVTTNLSADEAADAFGRIGTILGLTGDDYEELADSIVALGNAGASTESEITEITKRFAGQAKAAGLAKEDIVALASVTAALGFEPERGGTALSRSFGDMATNIALANKKGKAFAKLVGKPVKDLQDAIDRGEGLPIFLDVLKAIDGMKPTEANRTLKAIGVTSQSGRQLFINMAANIDDVTDALELSTEATGALGEEAQKRFDTVASKIAVFKNNLIDAGISIGEGMIPAIGRATEKLTKFLQQPENVKELQNLGKEIGDAIDNINWDEVIDVGKDMVDVFKDAFGWAKRIFDIFNALPSEIKGATVGLLALNKLSGGLIAGGVGDIVGGLGSALAKNLASSIPLFGKAFVQPVFVTNMGPGGLGGGPLGGGKGGGGAGRLLLGLTGVGLAAMLAEEFHDEISGFGQTLGQGWRDVVRDNFGIDVPSIDISQVSWPFGPKDTPTILPEVFGGNGLLGGTPTATPVRGGDRPSPGNPGIAKKLIDLKPVTEKQAATTNAVKNAQSIASRENSAQKTELGNIKSGLTLQRQQAQAQSVAQIAAQNAAAILQTFQAASQLFATNTQTGAVRTGASTTAAAARSAGNQTAAAQFAAASRIVAAIWAARPIVQSTTVVQKYTTIQRTGPTGGSRNQSGPLR